MADTAGDSPPVQDPTDAERRLWSAFPRGEVVDLRTGDAGADDPWEAEGWGTGRRVRAEVVVALMLGAVAPAVAHVPRLRLAGALVQGTVDARGGIVTSAVEMSDCSFTGNLLLAEAQIRTIDLSGSVLEELDGSDAEVTGSLILRGCRVKTVDLSHAHISGMLSLSSAKMSNLDGVALAADGMTVDGDMFCAEGFEAEGKIGLFGAHIGGQLSMITAKLSNPGGAALAADRMTVDGSMLCRKGFRVKGELGLLGAHIGGQLSMSGAKLSNPGEVALVADGMTVDGGTFCREGFQVQGSIRLPGAHIKGQLNLNGAKLTNSGGVALAADGMTVDGDMFCGEGFQVQGSIRLPGAHIKGQLNLDSAKLTNSDGTALASDLMTVDGGMLCGEGFQAQGEIRVLGAHIGQQLSFRGASLSNASGLALDCEALETESLYLDDTTIDGTVDLTSAQVRVLHDDPDRWPPQMRIDEFTYQSLEPYAEAGGTSGRLAWLARANPGYRAQPYEQLTAYYRRLGHDEEARRVLLAKQRRRRSTLGPLGKTTGYLLDGIVGYGYRPERAFAWLVVLLVAGSVYFTYNRPAPLDPAQHPHYQPVLYTADQLIPLVNLSGANVWAPGGISQWITFALVVLGWVLATAIVAGVTRVLARV